MPRLFRRFPRFRRTPSRSLTPGFTLQPFGEELAANMAQVEKKKAEDAAKVVFHGLAKFNICNGGFVYSSHPELGSAATDYHGHNTPLNKATEEDIYTAIAIVGGHDKALCVTQDHSIYGITSEKFGAWEKTNDMNKYITVTKLGWWRPEASILWMIRIKPLP